MELLQHITTSVTVEMATVRASDGNGSNFKGYSFGNFPHMTSPDFFTIAINWAAWVEIYMCSLAKEFKHFWAKFHGHKLKTLVALSNELVQFAFIGNVGFHGMEKQTRYLAG